MMAFAFIAALILGGIALVAIGLRDSAWMMTLVGLIVWWIGTFVMVVTLDLVAIGVTIEILSQPFPDFEITPRFHVEPGHEIPPPVKDKEA